MKAVFIEALPVLEKLIQAGHEAYFVGGAVRDSIIGRPVGDVDIATSAKPEQVMGLFEKTILVGIEHGTVVVVHKSTPYEVTTFRTEGTYEDFRRPSSVTFVSSLREDLQRRDFTVNAIAMDKNGSLVDPFHGQEAIRKKQLETVGKAAERFHEDALRMMRAVRFMSQLSFSVEAKTKEAIVEYGHLLEHVSIERTSAEFEKLLLGQNPSEALKVLAETGLYRYLPDLSMDDDKKKAFAASKWEEATDVIQSWAAIIILLGKQQADSFLRKWKLPNKRIKGVQDALDGYAARSEQPWNSLSVYKHGVQAALHVNKINRLLHNGEDEEHLIWSIHHDLPIHSLKELAVNGKDVMAMCSRKGGPWLSELLQKIEIKVIQKELPNEREAIKEWLQSCNQILDAPY
jgi:tRNA nucleotidyltransferase (CCA-adding enzyme)